MTSYWKLAVAMAAAMVLTGFGFNGLAFIFCPLAVLLAAYVGIRLAPSVEVYRHERFLHTVALMVVSAMLLGIGGWLNLSSVWALGLFGILVLPFAGMAQEDQQYA